MSLLNSTPSHPVKGGGDRWYQHHPNTKPNPHNTHISREKTRRSRRRINTEDKAKVVAALWGQNLFNFLLR